MLEVTATTVVIEWARRWHAPGGGVVHRHHFTKGVLTPLVGEADVHHIARGGAGDKHRQTVQVPDAIATVCQALNSDRAARQGWLDLGTGFVYILPRRGISLL
jgi:hypothetical protein